MMMMMMMTTIQHHIISQVHDDQPTTRIIKLPLEMPAAPKKALPNVCVWETKCLRVRHKKKSYRTTKRRNFFDPRAVTKWNNLPFSVVEIPSVNSF